MRCLFLLVILAGGCVADDSVPNCPDIDVLEKQAELSQEQLNNLLLCFCKKQDSEKVSISCLYGSNVEHLTKAIDAVNSAKLTVSKISIQHMDIGEKGLPNIGKLAPELEAFEVRECSSSAPPLVFPDDTFDGLEGKLRNLTVHSCQMEEIPVAVNKLESLESLTLSSNKLQEIPAEPFANKKQLSYLDLSGNFIAGADEDAFGPLTSLETLVIGEHNYMNESVMAEVGKLKGVKTLDFSRADGIFEVPMSLFDELTQLESLKLSGCTISSLEPGQFAALKKLKELDLRVNLIENVTAYAFDGLENLKRLSIAGNFIGKLEEDVFFGLSSLEELDVGYNEIKNISDVIFRPINGSLKSLNVRSNPIKKIPGGNFGAVETLNVRECRLANLGGLENYPKLKELDASRCNLTDISTDQFKKVAGGFKKLNLHKNLLKTIPAKLVKDLPLLESLDISANPLLCDGEMANLAFAIEDKEKTSEGSGRLFLQNSNDTKCDRPYSLRGTPLVDVQVEQFQPWNEKMDTTTGAPTTVDGTTEEPSTTTFKIPDLFIGTETNETLFKEEPRREIYDLNKANDPKGVYNTENSYAIPITIAVLGIISLIVLVAVFLFVRKNRKITADNKKKQVKVEDGMVEIELNSQTSNR